MAGNQTVGQVFQQYNLWQWWTQNGGRGTNMYNGTTEKGIDYANVYGTPIGFPSSGTVVRVVHNNNSINDVVEIQQSNGAVWLFQHINTAVSVGQTLGVGSIVGYQNGLPVDQYSTGSHIEVRYAPTGWSLNQISWNEPWVNPFALFSTLSNRNTPPGAIGPPPGTGGTPPPFNWAAFGAFLLSLGVTQSPQTVFLSVSEQVHETLSSNPGVYGIALALDEAEQFVGPENYATTLLDVAGMMKSVMATIVDNSLAALVRGTFILFGGILLAGLLWKIAENNLGPIMQAVAANPEVLAG